MRIDAISIGENPPKDINVIVEVPVGGHPIKYELDKEAGTLVVDRFLYTPMTYPGNYGFVPHTLSEDGDPIDVLICNSRPLVPGCVINCRPIGVLVMEDNAGQDEKIIAVPSPHVSRRFDSVKNYTDLPEITQQHGYIHGGVVGMIADSAAGFAASTLTGAETAVLTVEYKLNLLAPAEGQLLIAEGSVVRYGRTLIVTRAEVFAVHHGRKSPCALMQQTIIALHGKQEHPR